MAESRRPADDWHVQLGKAIRGHRREHGLTLVQLAAASQLSHPFLSQLERGLARPSMASLHRIARALGTTQQALLAHASVVKDTVNPEVVTVVRREDVLSVSEGSAVARLLSAGHRQVQATEYDGLSREWGARYVHEGEDLIYVVQGSVEIDVEGQEPVVVNEGETACYSGLFPHRARSVKARTRMLLIQPGFHDGPAHHE